MKIRINIYLHLAPFTAIVWQDMGVQVDLLGELAV